MSDVGEKVIVGVAVSLIVAMVLYVAKTARARKAFVDLFEDTGASDDRKRDECRQLYGLAFTEKLFSDEFIYEPKVNALRAKASWWRPAFFWNPVRVLERERLKSAKRLVKDIFPQEFH